MDNKIAAADQRSRILNREKDKLISLSDPKIQKKLLENLEVDPEVKKYFKEFVIDRDADKLSEEERQIIVKAKRFLKWLREMHVPEE